MSYDFRKKVARWNRSHSGLTLLETLLAIALSAVVLYLVGMAIDLHLRVLNNRREQVEQAQLARSILRPIASDLRNVLYSKPTELSGAQGFSSAGGQGTGSDAGGSTSSGSSAGSTSTGSGTTDSMTATAKPGLYGTRYEIQIDVSRTPRFDEYESLLITNTDSVMDDVFSEVKTVLYFWRPDDSNERTDGQGGLFHHVLDRAVTAWAISNGNLTGLYENAELLAGEVSALEFRYFDGLQWLWEWDSELMEGLPLAVEIMIEIAPMDRDTGARTVSSSEYEGEYLQGDQVYRQVVRLPTADITNQLGTAGTGGTSL
jgi:hypothetical protein